MMSVLRRALAAAAIGCALPALASAQPADPSSIVLVHGAFGDGSAWSRVIPHLQARGHEVIAVQLPLTSLAEDVAATRRAIARAAGPVTLVGHSWGGTVITEAGAAERVRSLVYVAAFANNPGESAAASSAPFPHAPGLDHLQVADGFARLSPAGIAQFLAPRASAADHALIGATQGQIRVASFGETVSVAAWQNRPSWYVVARQDRMMMIVPAMQEAMATRLGARVTRLESDHVPMLTQAEAVARVILEAAK